MKEEVHYARPTPSKLGCKLKDGWDVTLLAFSPVDNPAVAPGIVSFNWAVWAERSEYLPTLGYTPDRAASVRRILLRAGARMPLEKKTYGERSEKAVADFARNPPWTAWIFFTDGSALGNPVRAMRGRLRLQRQGHGQVLGGDFPSTSRPRRSPKIRRRPNPADI